MKLSWYKACQLDPSLSSISLNLSMSPTYAEPLSGGLTNRCWRIDIEQENPLTSYVWRPHSAILSAFDISRSEEYHVLQLVNQHTVIRAPRPQHLSPEGLLVEWVTEDSSTLEQSKPNPSVDEQLQLLAQIHQIKLQPKDHHGISTFDFTERMDHYWQQVEKKYQHTHFADIYRRHRQLPFKVEATALCHFDLGAHNLIRHQGQWVAIDWEYAAIADPKLDLAITLSLLDIPLAQGVQLYCQFAGIPSATSWIEDITTYLPYQHTLVMLWYLIHAEFYPQQEGLEMANFFASQIASHY